ncbi:MAG TPA: hypothetical protein PKG96_05200 [Bacilli bacterium]|jgi:hypothetical protein|nr:hypothetical protein [Bacilli bacterium]
MNVQAKEVTRRKGINNQNNSASYFRLYNTTSSLSSEIMIEIQLRNNQSGPKNG